MKNDADQSAIETLDPKLVWSYFSGIASVPRPSKKEQRIRAHVAQIARSRQFAVREDDAGNLLIEVPSTPGCERATPTLLQAHLDMVCEKNSGTSHDFDNDSIRLRLGKSADGRQIVRAAGTTLGADNGIGVAMAFAAATQPDADHGPLEILCTVDEEDGMSGAKAVAPELFKARRLLNLDSEEDDALYIGCAGGTDSTLTWSLPTTELPRDFEACQVSVGGLRGGHSGCDIHLNRGSAIGLLMTALNLLDEPGLRLAAISGGSKRNAIPREAVATIAGPPGFVARLTQAAKSVQVQAMAAGEANCAIAIEPVAVSSAATAEGTRRVLSAITALPHGVLAVVPEIPGLVQTSNGTTTIKSSANGKTLRIEAGCLSRSSSEPDMAALLRKIAAIASLAGASVETGNGYPGWSPNVQSPTLAVCRRVYERVFEKPPRIASIHAGLECGIIGQRVGGMDMVSFGPNIHGAHSPDEFVDVVSVARMYKYLLAVLAELARS